MSKTFFSHVKYFKVKVQVNELLSEGESDTVPERTKSIQTFNKV